MSDATKDLAFFHGVPTSSATLKAKPEHFFVSETLNFMPSGQGEHFLVQIRKKGENTKFVANELAKACGVQSHDVSWAGLKDKHAVTEQWFCVRLPGKTDPNLTAFVEMHEGVVAILASVRHYQKLRPGCLTGNKFSLLLTEVKGEKKEINARLELIKKQGVPNYFGSQRFGNSANNLVAARDWGAKNTQVRDKSKRGFYLSAARSHLFNLVLSARVERSLLEPMLGDLLIKENKVELVRDFAEAKVRISEGWELSGPMTGDNALPTQGKAQEIEQRILDQEPLLLAIIRANRMQHGRRPLMIHPKNLTWQWENSALRVNFALPAGAFATSVMREVIDSSGQWGAIKTQVAIKIQNEG